MDMAERVMTRGEKHRRSRTAALGDRVRHGGRGIGRRACNRNCRCVSASAYLWSNYNAGRKSASHRLTPMWADRIQNVQCMRTFIPTL